MRHMHDWHRSLVAQRHSYQAAAACDYNEVGRTELSRRFPCSNRVQRLTNANHDYPREELLVVLLKVSRRKKSFTNLKKCSAFIHPVGLASSSLPAGAPFKKWARKFTLGKMKNGGTVFPVAETARAKVTNFPLSADTCLPICLQPRRPITQSGVCTVVTPWTWTHLASFLVPNTECRIL